MRKLLNRLVRQALVLLATLAFLTISTVALTHSHSDAKSADESHCAICMAIHSSTHAIAAPIATLCFTAIQNPFLVPPRTLLVAFPCLTLNQDRAPPTF